MDTINLSPIPPFIRISGTFALDGEPFTIPDLPFTTMVAGRPDYTGAVFLCGYDYEEDGGWFISGTIGGTAAGWTSSEKVKWPWEVKTWTPGANATGTPTITRIGVNVPAPTPVNPGMGPPPVEHGGGSFDVASKEEAEAGVSNSHLMTPLRTKQAVEQMTAGVSVRRVALSKSGVISDTALAIGGTTTGDDQSAKIQDVLNLGEDGPLVVDWDVAATTSGLNQHSSTCVQLWPGSGMKLASDADNVILSNVNYRSLDGGDPSDATFDYNLSVVGQGILHGNAANQAHDTEEEGWMVGMRFFNVRGLILKDFAFYKPRTFSIHVSNASDVLLENLNIDVGAGSGYNYDGPHFNGPVKNLVLRNCSIKSMDDAIGLNADDAASQSDDSPGLFGQGWVSDGDITGVLYDRIHLNASGYGFRFLSASHLIDDVVVRDTWGEHGVHGTLIDNYAEAPANVNSPGVGNFGRITIDGWTARCTAGDSYHNAIHAITCSGREAIYRRIVRNDLTALATKPTWRISPKSFSEGSPHLEYSVCAVKLVDIAGYRHIPTGLNPLQRHCDVGRATIETLAFRDVAIETVETLGTGALVNLAADSVVGEIIIDGMKSGNCAALVGAASGATVGKVTIRNLAEPMFWEGGLPSETRIVANKDNPQDFSLVSSSGLTDAMYRLAYVLPQDVSLSGWFAASSFANNGQIVLGGRETNYGYRGTSRTGYAVSLSATTAVLVINGGSTLDTVTVTGGFVAGVEYFVEVRFVGSTQNVFIRRSTDMLWLQSDGSWDVAREACLTGADATKTGRNVWVACFRASNPITMTVRDVAVKHI
jgi:hypothetical protein